MIVAVGGAKINNCKVFAEGINNVWNKFKKIYITGAFM
jgi:hypothetical protein